VWERLRKTVAVMVGDESMRDFPQAYEPAKDVRMRWPGDREEEIGSSSSSSAE
jgi:hypothetical protein